MMPPLDRDERRRTALPYGRWVTADGREVIYDRRYRPLVQRLDGVISDADPAERVPWLTQAWFYTERDLRHPRTLERRLAAILAKFRNGEDVADDLLPTDRNGRR